MKYILKKTFLVLLRSLIYPKRALIWLLQKGLTLLNRFLALYRSTIGLAFYKVFLRIQKKLGLVKNYRTHRGVELLGKRSTLQIVLFAVAVIVMIPHSKLYTRDATQIPGRDTLLYKVVGPTEDFYEIEEVVADIGAPIIENPFGWREGSVSVDSGSTLVGDIALAPQEITNVSSGGNAIAKPTILPDSTLPTAGAAPASSNRSDPIHYAVQSGDTIGGIAEQFGLDVVTILWANNLTSRSYIRPGDRLLILPVDGVVHKVARGDTVSKIAQLYGATGEDIIKQNRLQENGADIHIGEELVVPGGEKIQVVARTTPQPRQYTSLSTIAAPPVSPTTPAGSGYLWPTTVRTITQYFGLRHTGVDIAGPKGSPLYATRAGTVIKSAYGYNGGYGNYIIIDHGDGIQSLYGHATELYVSIGEHVVQGQHIASMGSTGRSTGPHVHFEVRVSGRQVNPFQYIR